MDEAVEQMVMITATTPERAQQYLQVTDGDVSQAVSLFFENGGVDLGGGPTTATTMTGTGAAQDPINIDDEIMSDSEPTSTVQNKPRPAAGDFEDDEAMARRLQEEMYGGGGQEQEIRAPIARQTETLVGPGASDYYGGSGLEDQVQQRMAEIQQRARMQDPISRIRQMANS